MTQNQRLINAAPTKSFFIHTLVKDVQLIDAILDLIDNSIDGYIENDLRDRREISISFSENKFVIEDNCGGIKKEDIYEKVFRMGRIMETHARTIGVFGIGMKRAIFKMGKDILIESDDGKNFYSIRIDEEWLEDEKNWNLKFEKEEGTRGKPQTRISITEILPTISKELGSTTFENELIGRIKETYSIFIEEKVSIKVNGNSVDTYDFSFLYDEKKFRPYHKRFTLNNVEVEIYAGFAHGDTEEEIKTYGWFVFCNDRLILRNDTSTRTGWGGIGGKNYHYSQDNRFLGLVFFRSDNPLLLPWHTTKEDIQEDSPVYRKAQIEMRSITSKFVDVIRLAGRTKHPTTGETIGVSLFKEIPVKSRKLITKDMNENLPVVKGELIYEEVELSKWVNICYSKERELVEKVKKKLGNMYMSHKKAGEKTFDYYVKMEEIEDDEE